MVQSRDANADARLRAVQGKAPEAPRPHRGTGARHLQDGRGGPLLHRHPHPDRRGRDGARGGRDEGARGARQPLRRRRARLGRPGRCEGEEPGAPRCGAALRQDALNGWRDAVRATAHCLTGCAIGEVLGMVIATAFGWGNAASIAIAVVLAFAFGYALTLGPVLRAGVPPRRALSLAFASDTASITVMEITDNAFILLVPGAIDAALG